MKLSEVIEQNDINLLKSTKQYKVLLLARERGDVPTDNQVWIDDVLRTNMEWCQLPKQSTTVSMLLGIANTLRMTAISKDKSALSKATWSKLEALGFKTYVSLVKRVYGREVKI